MEELRSKDIDEVAAGITAKYDTLSQVRSMSNAKNLTANNNLDEIKPVGDKVLIALKSWPTQSVGGLFMPESHTIIRGEQYITQVIDTGEEVTTVSKGDIAVVSMYSGHHITTKSGHAKIISESDILVTKKEQKMQDVLSFNPKTFTPGINYILVKLIEKKTIVRESGIVSQVGEDDAFNKNDVVTKTAEVISLGPINEYGKKFAGIKEGTTVIFDAYVGMELNPAEVTDVDKYRVLYSFDILGFVDKK